MHMTLTSARGILLALIAIMATPGRVAAQAAACTSDCALTPEQIHATTLKIAGAEQEFAAATRQFALILTSVAADANGARAAIDSMAGALARWDQEITAFEKTSEPRRTPDVHLALGRAYAHRHRLDAALREFDEAVRRDPRRADAHMVSALVHLAAGRAAQAIAALRKTSDLDADNPAPYYLLARLYVSLGQDAEARHALQTFRERAEQKVVDSGRKGAAQPFEELQLRSAGEDAIPRFVPVAFADGFALFDRGQYDEAVAWFRRATAIDPAGARPSTIEQLLALGRAAVVNGDMASALKHLGDAASREPGRAEPHRVLAAVYAADGQYDRSILEFTAAVGAEPRDEGSWAALAETLATVGRFDQAEQVLQQANQRIQRSGQLHFSLGRLYQSLGRYPEATREFEAALDLHPLTGEDALFETLGGVYATLGAFDRAAETWTKRVTNHPNDAAGHRALGQALLERSEDVEARAAEARRVGQSGRRRLRKSRCGAPGHRDSRTCRRDVPCAWLCTDGRRSS
jgi:tetratricopeptide (TPR) repeat protein